MAENCPKCGSTNLRFVGGSTEGKAKYNCKDCGKTFYINTKNNDVPKGFSLNERLIKSILFGAVALYMVFLFPMGNSIRDLFETVIPNYDWVFWATVIIFMYSMLNSIWNSNSNGIGISYLLLIAITMIVSNIGLTYIESPMGQQFLLSTRCAMSGLFSPGTDITECMVPTNPNQNGPISTNDAITLDFDNTNSEYTIYKTSGGFNVKPFFILLSVENPSETRDVENFMISGTESTIRKSGNIPTKEKIEIAYLETSDGSCMDTPCDLEAGEKMNLVVKAEGISCDSDTQSGCELHEICEWDNDDGCSVITKDMTEVEVKLVFSYNYAVEETKDLLLSRDYLTIQTLLQNTESPSSVVDGPVYLKVSFAPSYHVFDEDDETAEIDVNIKLSNEGDGSAYLSEPIEITRIVSNGILSKPSVCIDPWGDEKPLDENEKITIAPDTVKIEDSATFTCTYSVDGNSVRESGEVIPITATARYTYEDTKYKKYIQIEEI